MPTSEIRKDPITGQMVIVAFKRSKRPHGLIVSKKRIHQPINKCPFENPLKSGHKEPLFLIEKERGDWSVMVILNKYPMVTFQKFFKKREWFFEKEAAIGQAEVVLTRDHKKSLAELPKINTLEMLLAFRERYNHLSLNPKIKFVFPFINLGKTAGASITHPHGQIISLSIISPYVQRILKGSENFYKKRKKCFYCSNINWEKKEKKRIIYENKEYFSFCPYVSTNPFEIHIYPKKHLANFGKVSDESLRYLSEALYDALRRIYKELNDPDYNLFIYSSFLKEHQKFFHFHLHLIPKTETIAGFELSSGMEACGLAPEEAAKRLRRIKI
jgi:UDPglucose--hexose-1-phosphate uridylyltransferase